MYIDLTMHVAQFAFLCFFLAPVLTIAQVHSREKPLRVDITIAGRTDSITIDEILSAGKLECPHKAFEIVSFVVASGGICVGGGGLYTEASSHSATFSPLARQLIQRFSPGHRFYITNIKLRNQAGQVIEPADQVFRICRKN